ncbi:PREDICTED: spermatid-specific manchette-related protein 1 [Chaetura pelagica]|uniref:spermatid-specific manchette-related protein 1 n=1 Tax=Chaetura pelagica TaxID=8897 RepID=UPI0005232019|nr:PREDICTED: spermatid-specific manchette-related protein 1 [Chaetura pelagica]
MFLPCQKHKTPVSTYTDSYRPPCTVRKTIKDAVVMQPRGLELLTKGLWSPPKQNKASQDKPQELIKRMLQEYYKNTIHTVCYPETPWPTMSKEKYKPVFVNQNNYITWRTGPYNSAAWSKHSCYLPFLPKEARMETFLHSIPVLYPPKPTCLNQCEREAMIDILHRLSRYSPPCLQPLYTPLYTVTGKGTCQGYYSPCSGRFYCLHGLDYHTDGTLNIRRHLHALGEKAEHAML